MDGHRTRRTGARSNAARVLGVASLTVALTPALGATPALAGPSKILLGTASNFAVLGGSGMTNTGASTIAGDVGSSPTHSETGFTPCPAQNCVSLTGANHNVADPNDAVTQQAKDDLTVAYLDAFGRTGGTAISAPLGGGTTLVSGLYTSADDVFVGGDLTLDAGGDPTSVFIFQAKTGTLTTAAGTTSGIPNTRIMLSNGAQACNVFWQVGSSATVETYSQFVGTILANQSITVNTGATIDGGRALARNGAVTLDTNTIKAANCATPPGDSSSTTPVSSTGATAGTGRSTPTATPASLAATAAAASGAARLHGPRGPVTGPFTVYVTGRSIAKVTYSVDGKRRSVVRAKRGRTRFALTIDPRSQSRRVHQVTARVLFTAASRKRATTLHVTYRRPVAPRSPRFAG